MDNYTQSPPTQPQPQVQQPYQPYTPYNTIPAPPQPPPTAPVAAQTGQAQQPSKRTLISIGIGLLAVILIGVASAVGGEPGRFVTVGAQIFPFAILAGIAWAGRKSSTAAIFAYITLAIFAALVVGFSFLITIEALIEPGALNGTSRTPFKPGAGMSFLVLVIILSIAIAVSGSLLFRPVRVAVSRFIPIDPDNFVHKIAICILTLLFMSALAPLISLGGKPPLLEVMNLPQVQQAGDAAQASPLDLVYQLAWTIPVALIGAGWPIARNFRTTLQRLGIVRPTLLQVVGALAIGVALAVLAAVALDPGINQFWQSMGWPTTDTAAFDKLMAKLLNPLGAVLIGVSAGVGEELAVRGLLQPRIGLIASNLVFTSLHAFQYGVDGLLSVFIIGLILGIIRARTNTTTSAIVHGTYDFTLVMGSLLNF
jgi:hypothetical protein